MIFEYYGKDNSGVDKKGQIEAVDEKEAVNKLHEQGLIVISINSIEIKKCPFCAEEIQKEAIKCKYCGEMLVKKEETLGEQILSKVKESQLERKEERYGVPAFMSLIIPGLGQIIKGQVGKGISMFIGTLIGYFLMIIPGIIMHIVTIYDAYNSPQKTSSGK